MRVCVNSIFIDQNKFILDLPLLFVLPLYSFQGAAIPPSPRKRLIQAAGETAQWLGVSTAPGQWCSFNGSTGEAEAGCPKANNNETLITILYSLSMNFS